MPIEILQLCQLVLSLEAALDKRFLVHRWLQIGDTAGFLAGPGARIKGIVTNGPTGAPADIVANLAGLEIIAINGVGFDKVDLAEARRRGVRVSNTPDVLTADVADLAIGMIISLSRHLNEADRFVRERRWSRGTPFTLGHKVSGRHFGIFGFGRIGHAIAQRLSGFGGTISYTARSPLDVPYGFFPDVKALAQACDVLILAASASPQTSRIIDTAVLDALGPQGLLINVARGSFVDEAALIEALAQGRIAGAGLDVFDTEPDVPEALIKLPNVLLTPHIGVQTHETRRDMGELVLANLDAHFGGRELPTPVV